jgi:hypothetical protein
MPVLTGTDVTSMLKVHYGSMQKVESVLYRNDPFFTTKLQKIRAGGKEYPLPITYTNSPAVGGDYTAVSTAAIRNGNNVSFNLTMGKLFGSFIIDPAEYLASRAQDDTFISIYALRMFGTMDSVRKLLTSAMYGSGVGDMGTVLAVDAVNFLYIDVAPSTAFAIDIGSKIMFAASISVAYRSPNPVEIASIADSGTGLTAGNVRITFSTPYVATVAVNDVVMLNGCRGASPNFAPILPIGFGQWFPTLANRAGSTWDTYIAVPFYGVNRSPRPSRLAGNFVLRDSGASEKYSDAVARGIKQARRGGGVPDIILLNDDDFQTIIVEMQAQRNFYQMVQGAPAKDKNVVTSGISAFQFAFSTNWIQYVYDSPATPKGVGYILDSATIMLVTFGNVGPITDAAPKSNEPGAPEVKSASDGPTTYQFLYDDMISTSDVDTENGKGIKVDFNVFATYGCSAPGHNTVVKF